MNKGFTLLETIIVTLLLGIVILFISLSFSFFQKSFTFTLNKFRLSQKGALIQKILDGEIQNIRKMYSTTEHKIFYENELYEKDSITVTKAHLVVSGKRVNLYPAQILSGTFQLKKRDDKPFLDYKILIHISGDSLLLKNTLPLGGLLPSL